MIKSAAILIFLTLNPSFYSYAQPTEIDTLAERFLIVTKKHEQNKMLMKLLQVQMEKEFSELAAQKKWSGKKKILQKNTAKDLVIFLPKS